MQRTGDTAAKAYPATRIARSLDEILADKSIDLAVVSTPNETHFVLAKRVLEAGKHVVIDKPFAATSEEARELGQLAKSKGLLAIPSTTAAGRRFPDRPQAAAARRHRPAGHLRVAL